MALHIGEIRFIGFLDRRISRLFRELFGRPFGRLFRRLERSRLRFGWGSGFGLRLFFVTADSHGNH